MEGFPAGAGAGDNPLRDDSPETWDRLIRALGPAAMLLCIRRRMQPRLLLEVSPEDIWQETLLHVWRDRSRCEWRGPVPFRRWVLQVVENRIRAAVERERAEKRGGGRTAPSLDELGRVPPPVSSTTPSRIASYREEAELMREALDGLPDPLREAVHLRLFEGHSLEEVADEVGLSRSGVKHRVRRGAALYRERYEALAGRRSSTRSARCDRR